MYYREVLKIKPELAEICARFPEELDGHFYLQKYRPHELIHQKNSVLTRVGILLEGAFRVVNELENGNIFMIEINEPISFTGEIALLSGRRITSITIETIKDCLIAFLPVNLFEKWLMNDISLLRYVSVLVANKLYSTSYHIGERMFYSTKYVVLNYILTNCAEQSGSGERIVRKTRQEICEEIGMSVNTINRTLQFFRDEGQIEIRKGKIFLDKQKYEKACEALAVYISENRNGAKS